MNRWSRSALVAADALMVPFIYLAGSLLKAVRRVGIQRLPFIRTALLDVGVFPVRDHYYEPQFDHRNPRQPFCQERSLPGIDWNIEGQLAFLARLRFAHELQQVSAQSPKTLDFEFGNGFFEAGDAEFWYQAIRVLKPRRIFEIGSGHSTLMAIRAIQRNQADDLDYQCRHVCVEPYEKPWLERTRVEVVRQTVETLPLDFFDELGANDVLFIDSSHVIRPQGDVLHELLTVLPSLRRGVVVHLHDIFSPRNYPQTWLQVEVRFWNEQYLLEAFLTHNADWEILAALNQLRHQHYAALRAVAPFLTPDREPGSFHLRKVI